MQSVLAAQSHSSVAVAAAIKEALAPVFRPGQTVTEVSERSGSGLRRKLSFGKKAQSEKRISTAATPVPEEQKQQPAGGKLKRSSSFDRLRGKLFGSSSK